MTRRRPETPLYAAPRFVHGKQSTAKDALEKRLQNALATQFQMITATPEQFARIQQQIDELRAQLGEKEKVERKPRTEPSEAQILKAIMELLHRHPKVARAWRQNSMVAEFQDRGGKPRFVRANTAHGMSDIMGILKDGRTLAIEVKSAKGDVKAHQHEFLNSISEAGGIAFVARGISDVISALEKV